MGNGNDAPDALPIGGAPARKGPHTSAW